MCALTPKPTLQPPHWSLILDKDLEESRDCGYWNTWEIAISAEFDVWSEAVVKSRSTRKRRRKSHSKESGQNDRCRRQVSEVNWPSKGAAWFSIKPYATEMVTSISLHFLPLPGPHRKGYHNLDPARVCLVFQCGSRRMTSEWTYWTLTVVSLGWSHGVHFPFWGWWLWQSAEESWRIEQTPVLQELGLGKPWIWPIEERIPSLRMTYCPTSQHWECPAICRKLKFKELWIRDVLVFLLWW